MEKNVSELNRIALLVLAVGALALTGCKMRPTYPASQIATDLRQMCATDYKLAIDTRHEGKSLQAHIWKVGLFKAGTADLQGLSRDSLKSLQDVLLCSTRIALSTDAQLDFIEVKFADVLTGASLTILRYVPDIRDSMLQRFGDTEYFSRLVIDVQQAPAARKNEKPSLPALGEVRWDKPVSLSEFLAKQIIMRARRESADQILAHPDLSTPDTLGLVVENWDAIQEVGPEEAERLTDLVRKAAEKVIQGYRFKGFREMVLWDDGGVALHRSAF